MSDRVKFLDDEESGSNSTNVSNTFISMEKFSVINEEIDLIVALTHSSPHKKLYEENLILRSVSINNQHGKNRGVEDVNKKTKNIT